MRSAYTTSPDTSPWGQIDHREKLANGVFWVSTPSHGGLMVHAGTANARLSSRARDKALIHGRWLCFEEDCQYAIAFFEQPSWRMQSTEWSRTFASEEECRGAMREIIDRWYPDYFVSRLKHTPGPWKQHVDGEKTYATVRGSDGRCVADCGSRSDKTAQANARLIALTPEMCDALLAVFSLSRKEIESNEEISGGDFLEDFLAWRVDYKDVLVKLESGIS